MLYSVVRLGTFALALAVLLLLQVEPWLAAIAAAIIGLCVSYVLLPKQRAAVVKTVADIRIRADKDDDNDAENDALDSREAAAAAPPITQAPAVVQVPPATPSSTGTPSPARGLDDDIRDRP